MMHSFFLVLTQTTHDQLINQVQYYKNENEIMRRKLPKQITITPAERRRLLKFGKLVGPAIKELITIVHPRTFARWILEEKNGKTPANRGRPRTKLDIRQFIIRLAAETGWGYSRILGELKKLAMRKIGRTTVQNILKAEGFDPGPRRGTGTWDEFIKRHAKTLYACDFLSKKIWTKRGLVDYFILVFIHIDSRKVWVSPASAHPNGQWVAQQARNFCIHLDEQGQTITHLIHDRDCKFGGLFDVIIKAQGAKVIRLPIQSPNLNAFCERFIQTLKHECLDRFMVFGEKHLNYLVDEFVGYYHIQRPHQGKGNVLLIGSDLPTVTAGKIHCEERLGGLIKHYYRKAA